MYTVLFPFRKKLKCTSRYIYQTLFLNGENSDIRICALGQEWNLHKVYLCQVHRRFNTCHKDCASETNATNSIECSWMFLAFFCSRAISPACSVDLGKSPTWWKSTWRSQTRTSTLKVGRRWRKFKLWLFTLLLLNMNEIFLCVFYLQLCKSYLARCTGMMCWSSPAGLSVFSLLLVCSSWSVWWKTLRACRYCCCIFLSITWVVTIYRMGWSSSVERPWRRTSAPKLCVATMPVPASMGWTPSWRSQSKITLING